MYTRGLCNSFMMFICSGFVMGFYFRLKVIFMRYALWQNYVYLGKENQLIFGMSIKEPSLIIMGVVVWDTTMFYVLKRGCLGTCLGSGLW